MAYIELFSPAKQALGQEIKNHPQLQEYIAQHGVDDFEVKLAEIGLYCGVAIDGEFSAQGVDKLCEYLHAKLVQMRTGLII